MNDEVSKIPKRNYLFSLIISLLFVTVIAVFADKFDVKTSVLPFLFVAIYDVLNVLLVRKASPRECFKLFAVSVLSVFIIYKIISVTGIIKTYKADGFFSDTESNFYFIFDAFMVINMVSTYIFLVFLRFMMAKTRFRDISKVSAKRFAVSAILLIFLAIGDLLLWNLAAPYENDFLDYVSTYSTEKWVAYPNKRIDMFKDFEKNYSLKGMEKSDVEKLLGEPETKQGYEMGYDKNGHNILSITYINGVVDEYEIKQIKK